MPNVSRQGHRTQKPYRGGGDRVILTLWENGSLVGVSSHESDEIVENMVSVNPTSSAFPSYEAIKESEPSRISSADARALGYDVN